MKLISDLYIALKKPEFYDNQVKKTAKKHILFVTPQLSIDHLYKILLPALGLYRKGTITAITSLEKYNPISQFRADEMKLNRDQILWADFIVIPFTIEAFTLPDNKLYDYIRMINTQCKIVYFVDFNFYVLRDDNPYKKLITPQAIINIENNIWFSDICMITNTEFIEYLLNKMNLLAANRMKGVPTKASITCMPLYSDIQIMLENVVFDLQHPEKINPFNTEKNENNPHHQSTKTQIDVIKKTAEKQKQENILKTTDKKIKVNFIKNRWCVNEYLKQKKIKLIGEFTKKSIAIEIAMEFSKKGFDVLIYRKDGEIDKSIIKAIPKQKK